MHLEVITPESKVFAGEAKSIQLPGKDGLFQVLDNHAPIISALTSGKLKIELSQNFEADEKTNVLIQTGSNPKWIQIEIKGGVIEMQNNKIIVLAE